MTPFVGTSPGNRVCHGENPCHCEDFKYVYWRQEAQGPPSWSACPCTNPYCEPCVRQVRVIRYYPEQGTKKICVGGRINYNLKIP